MGEKFEGLSGRRRSLMKLSRRALLFSFVIWPGAIAFAAEEVRSEIGAKQAGRPSAMRSPSQPQWQQALLNGAFTVVAEDAMGARLRLSCRGEDGFSREISYRDAKGERVLVPPGDPEMAHVLRILRECLAWQEAHPLEDSHEQLWAVDCFKRFARIAERRLSEELAK
jgi:hypothetical protein